jgi:transposase InsO family protein
VSKILQEYDVRPRLVMPYTPQQNGCSERENRTLVEAARATRLAHGELPQALWAELINAAAYILNRTGPSTVNGQTLYEV